MNTEPVSLACVVCASTKVEWGQCSQCLRSHPDQQCVLCSETCFLKHFKSLHRSLSTRSCPASTMASPMRPCSPAGSVLSESSKSEPAPTVAEQPVVVTPTAPRAPKFVRSLAKSQGTASPSKSASTPKAVAVSKAQQALAAASHRPTVSQSPSPLHTPMHNNNNMLAPTSPFTMPTTPSHQHSVSPLLPIHHLSALALQPIHQMAVQMHPYGATPRAHAHVVPVPIMVRYGY